MKIRIPGVRKLRKRTGQPVVGSDPRTAPGYYHEQFTESSFSARHSKWDVNKARSSQEWKAEELMDDGTEQPVVIPQRKMRPQQFIIGNHETESELSVESGSFVSRVDDEVRTRQKRISNVTEDGEKHFMIWRMFMTVTMESAVFMGKNYLDNRHSITNTKDLTLKQMFDISTRLVSEEVAISGMETIGWENHSWKYMSLIGDERVINHQRTKVYVFSDSVCLLVRSSRTPNRTMHGKKDWDGSNHLRFTEAFTESTVSQWNSSGIFPRIQYVAAQ